MTTLADIKKIVETRPLIEDGDFISQEALELIASFPHWRRKQLFGSRPGDRAKFDIEMPCPRCGKITIVRGVGQAVIINGTYLKQENEDRFLCDTCRERNE